MITQRESYRLAFLADYKQKKSQSTLFPSAGSIEDIGKDIITTIDSMHAAFVAMQVGYGMRTLSQQNEQFATSIELYNHYFFLLRAFLYSDCLIPTNSIAHDYMEDMMVFTHDCAPFVRTYAYIVLVQLKATIENNTIGTISTNT